MSKKTKKDIKISIISALIVGASHGVAHYIFGTPQSFIEAGVTPVGITVTITAGIVMYITRRNLWLVI